MKSLYALALVVLLIAPMVTIPPAFAQHEHHQSDQTSSEKSSGRSPMMTLHGNFSKMKDLSSKAKDEKDTKMYAQMVQQHLVLMRESMDILSVMQNEMMTMEDDRDKKMGTMSHHMSMMEDMMRAMEAHSAMLKE